MVSTTLSELFQDAKINAKIKTINFFTKHIITVMKIGGGSRISGKGFKINQEGVRFQHFY